MKPQAIYSLRFFIYYIIMGIIDTHAHIYVKQFAEDSDEMIQKAKEQGVEAIFMPNIDFNTIAPMLALANKYPNYCYPMLGLHPCDVKENYKQVLSEMKPLFEQDKYYGVGETGLDYHWDLTFKKEQKEALKIQTEWANEMELPLILHTRKSFEDTFEVVSKNKSDNLTGIFHCFGGSVEDAQKVFNIGFYIGIGGVLTFKKSGLDKVIEQLPLDKVVIETDSPYLAPTPFRGKRNEPAYTNLVVEKMTEVKGMSKEEVIEITSNNARELFGV